MKSARTPSRRQFLRRCAAAAAGLAAPLVVPASALGLGGVAAPSDRITIGFIGTGDHGVGRNINRFLPEPDAQCVAVCDVDHKRMEDARTHIEKYYSGRGDTSFKGCTAHPDFREVIERKDIDAVMVSTPDHWHVLPSVMAARAGKDVMCEKPLTLTVGEGRVLADTIAKHGRVFQTASENRSIPAYHRMAELVRNGRIGKLRRIKVGLPTGRSINAASLEVKQPPEWLDFEMWLGPAPKADYCEARCHWNFRWIFDY